MKLKIAVITPSLQGAPTRYIFNYIEFLNQEKIQVDLYILRGKPSGQFNVQCLHLKNLFSLHTYDIIHTHGFYPDIIGFILKKFAKSIWVTTIHSYLSIDLSLIYGFFWGGLYSRLWYLILGCSDSVVCSSSDHASYLKKRIFFNPNFHVIAYGSPTACIETSPDKYPNHIKSFNGNNSGKILFSVGRLVSIKGYHQILNALPFLPEYRFVVVGKGDELCNLKKLASAVGVDKRVIFAGYYTHPFSICPPGAIYVTCSYSEGFNLALLEAMSLSLPIVLSNLPVYREYFSENDASFFELDNTLSLVEAVKKADFARSQFSRSSNILYNSLFTSKLFSQRYSDFYSSLILNRIS
jgi:glycosyltransferase involved in cell wall biosynthesis